MRCLIAIVLFVAAATGADPALTADHGGQFLYAPMPGWRVATDLGDYDTQILPSADGVKRNVVIRLQLGSSPLAVVKEKYERDLAKALPGFQLVSSEVARLPNGDECVRLEELNSAPGVPVRQIDYVVVVGERRYFIACTLLAGDDPAPYRAPLEAFVSSMRPAPPSIPRVEVRGERGALRRFASEDEAREAFQRDAPANTFFSERVEAKVRDVEVKAFDASPYDGRWQCRFFLLARAKGARDWLLIHEGLYERPEKDGAPDIDHQALVDEHAATVTLSENFHHHPMMTVHLPDWMFVAP